MVVCCQNVSHPAGNMPSTVCMFSSGLIPMGYALYISLVFCLVLVQFLPLICGRLPADLDSSHVFIVLIYSDIRDI